MTNPSRACIDYTGRCGMYVVCPIECPLVKDIIIDEADFILVDMTEEGIAGIDEKVEEMVTVELPDEITQETDTIDYTHSDMMGTLSDYGFDF